MAAPTFSPGTQAILDKLQNIEVSLGVAISDVGWDRREQGEVVVDTLKAIVTEVKNLPVAFENMMKDMTAVPKEKGNIVDTIVEKFVEGITGPGWHSMYNTVVTTLLLFVAFKIVRTLWQCARNIPGFQGWIVSKELEDILPLKPAQVRKELITAGKVVPKTMDDVVAAIDKKDEVDASVRKGLKTFVTTYGKHQAKVMIFMKQSRKENVKHLRAQRKELKRIRVAFESMKARGEGNPSPAASDNQPSSSVQDSAEDEGDDVENPIQDSAQGARTSTDTSSTYYSAMTSVAPLPPSKASLKYSPVKSEFPAEGSSRGSEVHAASDTLGEQRQDDER